MSLAPLFTPPHFQPHPDGGTLRTFPPPSIKSEGDVLQATAGLAQSGTITQALAPNPSTSLLGANSVLAATLNPAVNLPLSAQLQVTDFVNTNASAFSTPITAPDTQTNTAPSPTTNTNSQTGDQPTIPPPSQTPEAQTAIYNSVASASTSTIRGASINVVT